MQGRAHGDALHGRTDATAGRGAGIKAREGCRHYDVPGPSVSAGGFTDTGGGSRRAGTAVAGISRNAVTTGQSNQAQEFAAAAEAGDFHDRHPCPRPIVSLDKYRQPWQDRQRWHADHYLFQPATPVSEAPSIQVAACCTVKAAPTCKLPACIRSAVRCRSLIAATIRIPGFSLASNSQDESGVARASAAFRKGTGQAGEG